MIPGTILRRFSAPSLSVSLAIALVIRLIWILWAWSVGVRPASDAAWYTELAQAIVSGSGYAINGNPTAYWPVGYPAFLAAIFAVTDGSLVAAMVANALLYCGVIAASYAIAKRIFKSESVARITAIILALYPNHIAYSSLLLGEPLAAALVMASIALMLSAGRKFSWRWGLAGLLAGAATLVKPQMIVLPALVAFIRWWPDNTPSEERPSLIGVALLYSVVLVVLLPWMYRNYDTFGQWGVVSTNDGINLYIGNNPRANGTYLLDDGIEQAYWQGEDGGQLDEVERNARARWLAVDYITTEPLSTVAMWPVKLWYLFRSDAEGFTWNRRSFGKELRPAARALDAMKWVSQGVWVLLLGAAGAACIRRGGVWSWSGLGVVGYTALVGLVYFGDPRFHFMAVPWLVMFAATLWGPRGRARGAAAK